jgi:hypothetical protein
MLAGLLVSLLLASEGAQAGPPPCPHWCEDLGLDCKIVGKNSAALVELASLPPTEFLPPSLVQYVERCEYARKKGNTFSLDRLHKEANPLRGVLDGILLVPKEQESTAELPGSGARLVADCRGLDLHLKARPASSLKKNIQAAIDAAKLTRGLRSFASSGPITKAVSCSFEELTQKQFQLSVWEVKGSSHLEIAFIPKFVVDRSCFGPAEKKIARKYAAPAPGGKAGELALEQYKAALRDIHDEATFLNDYCGYMTEGKNDDAESWSECIEENKDAFNTLGREFQNRLKPEAIERLETQMADHAGGAEAMRHLARALMIESQRASGKPDASIEEKFDEYRSWCMNALCECGASGVAQILMSGIEIPNRLSRSMELYESVKKAGCESNTMDVFSLIYSGMFSSNIAEL